MKITEALLAEHQVFHNLFDHLERAAPKLRTLAEIKTVAAMLEAAMTAHSKTEDELFIGPLDHCFEQLGQCQTFHEEHDGIDRELQALKAARDVRKARQLLLTVVATSRSHFDKEERIVFPLAERVLKSKTLLELGDQWMKRREATLK